MTIFTELEFLTLDTNHDNYLSRVLDAEIHLDVINLGETIIEKKTRLQVKKMRKLCFFFSIIFMRD